MKSVWLGAVGFTALCWWGTPVQAGEIVCPGDCDGSNTVAINELISCVNIALNLADVETCPECDTSGNGMVEINELISAVNVALDPSICTGGNGARCGNGVVETGEDCDDGDNFGGQPNNCAANCTSERQITGTLDPARTIANVQSAGFLVGPLNLTGSQVFRVGEARNEPTLNAAGDVIFGPMEIPVVIRAEDLRFDPVSVLGSVCACVRGFPAPALFGPGVSGSGSIGCSAEGLTDVSYRVIQDHNTDPGDPGNTVMATPDDPECDDVSVLPGGTESTACRELEGEDCSDPERFVHPGVCNGPRVLTRSGGPAGQGSAFILNNSAIGQLQGGNCNLGLTPPCNSQFEDYGPDCKPCTDDDLEMGTPNNLPTTTGTAEAAVFDANNGVTTIDKGLQCGTGMNCVTSSTGENLNCDEVMNPSGGLSQGALAVAFPAIDALTISDNVTSTTFVNQ